MSIYKVIKPGIEILVRDYDNAKTLCYRNFIEIDETDYLQKFKIKAVTIVKDFIEANLSQIKSAIFLITRDCDFRKFNPESFYELKELEGIDFIDSLLPKGFTFNRFPKLEQLELNWDKSYDFSNCVKLRNLILRKTHSENLQPLQNLPDLENLDLRQGKLKSINGIESYKKLRAFSMYSMREIDSLENLSALEKLEKIEIINYHKEIDLSIFKTLPNLRYVYLENCTNITNIKALESYKSLKAFGINGKSKATPEEKLFIQQFRDFKGAAVTIEDVRQRIK